MGDRCKLFSFAKFSLYQHKSCQSTVLWQMHLPFYRFESTQTFLIMLFAFSSLLHGIAYWLNHSTCSGIHQVRKHKTPNESLKDLYDKNKENEPLPESCESWKFYSESVFQMKMYNDFLLHIWCSSCDQKVLRATGNENSASNLSNPSLWNQGILILESLNHRMLWVGRELKIHLVLAHLL